MSALSLRLGGWAQVLALWLLVFLAYWPAIGGGFAFDDYPNIVHNRALHVSTLDPAAWWAAAFSSPASDLQRPLSMLTFAVNHYFSGLAPGPMKATNIALHALNSVLCYRLAQSILTASRGPSAIPQNFAAFFVAAAWAAAPINFIAVALTVQRMEVLSHTVVLATLLLYTRMRIRSLVDGRNRWPHVAAVIAAGTAVGVLAKESAALIPAYAYAVEFFVFRFKSTAAIDADRIRKISTVLLAVPVLAAALWAVSKFTAPSAYAFRPFTLPERLFTEARVLVDYLQWTLLPTLQELALHHDDYVLSRSLFSPISTGVSVAVLLGLACTAAVARHRFPIAGLGIVLFFVAHSITATVIPLELVFEHRNYFSSFGLFLALADLLRRVRWRVSAGLATAAAVTLLAGMTHLRAREWSDPLTFAVTEARKHPRSPRSVYSAGQSLVMASNYQTHSPLFALGIKTLHDARMLSPSGVLPHSSLIIASENGTTPANDEVWDDMRYRLRTFPVGPEAANAVASLSRCARDGACTFKREQMVGTFEAALVRGEQAEVLAAYADYTFNVLRDHRAAIRLMERAIRAKPRVRRYRIDRDRMIAALGAPFVADSRAADAERTGPIPVGSSN